MPSRYVPSLLCLKSLTSFLLPFPWPVVKSHTFIILCLDHSSDFLTGVPISNGHASGHPNSDPSCTQISYILFLSFSFFWSQKALGSNRGGWSNIQTPQFSNQGSCMKGLPDWWIPFPIIPLPPHTWNSTQASLLSGAELPPPRLSSHHYSLLQCSPALFILSFKPSLPKCPPPLYNFASARLPAEVSAQMGRVWPRSEACGFISIFLFPYILPFQIDHKLKDKDVSLFSA